jgi:ABC-type sugar transport system permease subunit
VERVSLGDGPGLSPPAGGVAPAARRRRAVPGRGVPGGSLWEQRSFPVGWLLPVLLPILLFTLYPVAYALWTSLHKVMLLLPVSGWAGLGNYRKVVTSEYFGAALWNSVLFTLISAPVTVFLGTLVAHFLRQRFFGRTLVRSVVLLPWVLPAAISAVLWVWVFQPSWGILNGLLRKLGLIDHAIPWLTDPGLAFVSVVTAHIWTQIPFAVVLIMAALSTINTELFDAAAIDGANPLQRFRHVNFPHIKSMVVVLLVYNALTAFTSYDLIYAMTGGGPGTATTLLSFQIWKESFSMYDFGAGSAVAFIMVAISVVMIVAISKAMPSDLFREE